MALRPARFAADFEAAAAVISAANPHFPTTPDLLAAQHAAADPALKLTQWVAEVGGEVVGMGRASQQDAGEHRGSYFLRLWVAADWQCRGVGRALLRQLEQAARTLGAGTLKTMLSQDVQGGAGTGREQRVCSYLDALRVLAGGRPGLGFLRLRGAALWPPGVRPAVQERDRRLWELDWRLRQDVPMAMVFSRTPLEVWVRQRLDDPTSLPGLSFVALDPARADPLIGPSLGWSTLHAEPNGDHDIGMTGTLPEYRGRGVAKAMKVRAMLALQARLRQAGSVGVICTFNVPPNIVMLGMNAALGFVRGPDIYRYERELT